MLRLVPVALLAACVTLAVPAGADEARPRVRLETSMGEVVVELLPERAPETVSNFLRYVRDGFYGGTIFHRVIDGFMAQGGGFTEGVRPKETRDPIRNEADRAPRNRRGTVAMARTGRPHSATSQFFINVADNDFLDHREKTLRGWGYAVFGRVVEGMDVVDRMVAVPTTARGAHEDVPRTAIVIRSATVVEPTQEDAS